MRKGWTVAAAAALLFVGVALVGCKCCGDEKSDGGAAPAASACADCKAAGGQCAKCAAAAKPAEPAK